MSKSFISVEPSLSDYWRAIVPFGRNTTSYKFALAKTLLELGSKQQSNININDLSKIYSKHICEHLNKSDIQGTNATNTFLDNCRSYNKAEIDLDELITATKKDGFRYVFDAFHNLPGGNLPISFFEKSNNNSQEIILKDDFFNLLDATSHQDLTFEVEGRWSLVESAWRLNLSNSLVGLNYDRDSELILEPDKRRRTVITSAREALNGYQKGHCFYCFKNISIIPGNEDLADVDHFLPHKLGDFYDQINLDGIWNLVLSCKDCNRGEAGKFEKIPTINFLERLHKRNSFFIDSHHPLRETLILQTGKTNTIRMGFLNKVYNLAEVSIINKWSPQIESKPLF